MENIYNTPRTTPIFVDKSQGMAANADAPPFGDNTFVMLPTLRTQTARDVRFT